MGVKYGDLVSPKLFTSLLENIFLKLNYSNIFVLAVYCRKLENIFIKLNWSNVFSLAVHCRKLAKLRYADDAVLVASSYKELQEMVNEVSKQQRFYK